MRAALVLAVLLAGCTEDAPPASVRVPAPEGGGWVECPPAASRGVAVAFRSAATNETGGRAPGVHRLDARAFLWVWADEEASLRQDRVARVNPVEVALDAAGTVHVCTRVDVAAPSEVDGVERPLRVGARLEAQEALPAGPVRVVVNWVAGCDCPEGLPRGNATARFDG